MIKVVELVAIEGPAPKRHRTAPTFCILHPHPHPKAPGSIRELLLWLRLGLEIKHDPLGRQPSSARKSVTYDCMCTDTS